MKKITYSTIFSLVFLPTITFALTSGGAEYLTPFSTHWYANYTSITENYLQYQVYTDDPTTPTFCGDVVLDSGFTDHTDTFNIPVGTRIIDEYLYSHSSNTTLANGCIDDSGLGATNGQEYYAEFYSEDLGNSVVVSSFGGTGSSTVVSASTTNSVVNNPTLDFFLGFLIFFICMVFPIWLFRRK